MLNEIKYFLQKKSLFFLMMFSLIGNLFLPMVANAEGGPNIVSGGPGNLSLSATTASTITLNYGAAATYANFAQYIVVYDVDPSGTKTLGDMIGSPTANFLTANDHAELGYINYNNVTSFQVTNLSPSTYYTFVIVAANSLDMNNITEIAPSETVRYSTSSIPPPTVGSVAGPTNSLVLDAVADSSANIHAVFMDPDLSGNLTFVYRKYNGSSWGSAHTLKTDTNNSGINHDFSIAIDSSGNPGIVWTDEPQNAENGGPGGDIVIHYTKFSSGSWSNDLVVDSISNANYSGTAKLAFNSSGQPVVVASWSQKVYHLSNGSFSGSVIASYPTNMISLTIDSLGRYYVAGYDGSTLTYSFYNGSSWSTQTVKSNIGASGSHGYIPIMIKVNSSNNPRIVYAKDTPNGQNGMYDVTYYFTSNSGGGWSNPVQVSTQTTNRNFGGPRLISVFGLDFVSYTDDASDQYVYSRDAFSTTSSGNISPSGSGLIFTGALPVYDTTNEFRFVNSFMEQQYAALFGDSGGPAVPEFPVYMLVMTAVAGYWMLKKTQVV